MNKDRTMHQIYETGRMKMIYFEQLYHELSNIFVYIIIFPMNYSKQNNYHLYGILYKKISK